MTHTSVAIQKNIEEYCEARDRALIMAKQQFDMQDHIKEYLSDYGTHLMPHNLHMRGNFEAVRREMDRSFWRRAFELTNFRLMMDAEAKAQFDRDLDNNSPEFTMGAVTETFLSLAQDADMMFRRGLVNVFKGLCGDYKTNKKEPFRIGEKIIISHAIGDGWSGCLKINWGREQMINDIDRVFKVIAGDDYMPRSLESQLNESFMKGETFEDAFYKAKAFKNGNMHLWIKRQDILDQANILIAKHYGENRLAA